MAIGASYEDDYAEMCAEIERLRAQRDQLLAALNLVMVGGNHLANVLIGRLGGGFAAKFPPDLDHEIALRKLGATDEYDVWCCWAAIMTARAAVEKKP
jgi:hypothetical protein